ncbi:hypothetical protein ACSFA8_10875 [Variovorax sp. RT4R15]|uniref:hypothetical protein n=1 Tax=Variovorax sp. RT4R15 TaxID=3443737 RepID=UPI003F44EB5B
MNESAVNWGSVADWVSGIGSLAAVITALYLSHWSQRVRLAFTCRHMAVLGQGIPSQDLVLFSATNVGSRSTVVRNITMRVGLFRPRYAVLVPHHRDLYCAGIPKALSDGESADWGIPLDEDRTWIKELSKDLVASKWDLFTLRFQIHTSNGSTKSIRPDLPIRNMLKASFQLK